MLALGPAPCDGCSRAARCARGLACSAFGLYAAGDSVARWRLAPRTDATAERFDQLFGEARNDDARQSGRVSHSTKSRDLALA